MKNKIKNYFKKMKNKKTRSADAKFRKFLKGWNREIVVVKKSKIKLWQAAFLVAFIIGSIVGTFWIVRTNRQEKTKAAEILPPAESTFTWPALPDGDFTANGIRMTANAIGGEGYWIFEPQNVPTTKKLPVVIFIHGVFALNPNLHAAWITHLVQRGNVVVYPEYADSVLDKNYSQWTGNAISGLKSAYAELTSAAGNHTKLDLDRIAIVGHSIGAIIGADIANHWDAEIKPGLPAGNYYPKVLMGAMTGWIEGITESWVMNFVEDYGNINYQPKVLIVRGEADVFATDGCVQQMRDGLYNVSNDNKVAMLLRNDFHADQRFTTYQQAPNNLIADHFAPNGWANYNQFNVPQTPLINVLINMFGGTDQALAFLQKVNTLDYKLWNLFDWTCKWGFTGDLTAKSYSYDDTTQQRSLGNWNDGIKVNEMQRIPPTETVSPAFKKTVDESGVELSPTTAKDITDDSQYIQWRYSDTSPILSSQVKFNWKNSAGTAMEKTISLPFAGTLWGAFNDGMTKLFPNKIKSDLGLGGVVNVEVTVKDIFNNTTVVTPYKINLPQPGNGNLYINSTPTGANIILNGWNSRRPTNWMIVDVTPEPYAIKLTKSCYQDYSATVTVPANGTSSLNATLTATPPSCPAASTITCGQAITSTNGCGSCSGTGTKCAAGQTCNNNNCVANSTNGSLAINSTPTGANIYINGWNSATLTSHTWTDLKPEAYAIVLTKSCYNNYSTNVTVPTGGTGTLNATLTATAPTCPAASTVTCGQAITPTNGCGTCSGTGTKCSTGYTCSSGTCKIICTNKCTLGTKQCSTDYKGVQTCSDTNNDGCTEWGSTVACPGSSGCWSSGYGGTNECYCTGKTADGYDVYAKVGGNTSGYYWKSATSNCGVCSTPATLNCLSVSGSRPGEWMAAPSTAYKNCSSSCK